jgi:hypothetical protein
MGEKKRNTSDELREGGLMCPTLTPRTRMFIGPLLGCSRRANDATRSI